MGLIEILECLGNTSVSGTVTLLEELDQAGVVFRSATEPFDTATPMGRMLLQMLAMFAQFERDTIIDRVIGGMERKAAKGLWMGGNRPFGYQVDRANWKLLVDEKEAAIVRLIFNLYVRDRLGTRAIAKTLNERGHRTTTGGHWSGHQVIRVLDHRVYLGELTFREITVIDTHEPIIDQALFAEAEKILIIRTDGHAHRAASDSDYYLTGRMRCPQCTKAMLGSNAKGRNRTYRYYTCFTRLRYSRDRCDAPRLDADALDQAVLTALAGFYRDHHQLIADAVQHARQRHDDAHSDRAGELTTVQTDLTQTDQAIDRYLSAFERGTLDEETLATRLAALRIKQKQLRRRHTELTAQIGDEPVMPPRATLRKIANHIDTIIEVGTDLQRKALVEALIDEVKILGPGRLQPIFRVPRPEPTEAATAALPATTPSKGTVRTMPNMVGRVGLEPTTGGL
ncbi:MULTISPECIES: recombinase family protein [unclassified Pseudofrankia]|uniref:recombinase family protein n=1 Tax=unclassified Pseudofrankia TaxID=2994372 RepID=UPI000A7F5BEA|nr:MULTISPECIES: recombinase family protein [unclassified Pseudofrankia]MDT3445112.1 recombinase family protein [Pseudofrankia sp. BMG5.37]